MNSPTFTGCIIRPLGQPLGKADPMLRSVMLLNLKAVGGTTAFMRLVGLDLGFEITAGRMKVMLKSNSHPGEAVAAGLGR